ncbi:MAG: EexN family lipoprotein [Proteobacteria bacterium]|nr:EexN family lipoprotein [Pseudomonadota bacterium]
MTALLAACGAPPPPPHSVGDLAEDPELLQGIVARCATEAHASADVECSNARLAVERLAAEEDARRSSERGAAFERQREQRRERDEQKRRAAEQTGQFDPYSSPVSADKPAEAPKP